MRTFFKKFYYAFNGIRVAVAGQSSLKIQLGVALVVIAAGFYFDVTPAEWIAIIFSIGIVISLEMFNTAIEYVVNMISPDRHPIAGKIKDIAAGAVLFFSIAAVITGVLIFKKYLLPL